MVKRTLAAVPLASPDLTSKSPWPKGLHVGIPIGHPISTVLISVPIIFRFSGEIFSVSHFLTGSLPLSFLKNTTVIFLPDLCIATLYLFRYVLSRLSLAKIRSGGNRAKEGLFCCQVFRQFIFDAFVKSIFL